MPFVGPPDAPKEVRELLEVAHTEAIGRAAGRLPSARGPDTQPCIPDLAEEMVDPRFWEARANAEARLPFSILVRAEIDTV